MFDRDALNNEWVSAARAYKKFEEFRTFYDERDAISECSHKVAKRNKDGSRDKRSECRACWDDIFRANDLSNSLYLEWTPIWDLFERIGMSVKSR